MYTETRIIWNLGRRVLARLTYELRSGIRGYNEAKLVLLEEVALEQALLESATRDELHGQQAVRRS